jgi:outer membrane receptor for ferrienterochelin and colicin
MLSSNSKIMALVVVGLLIVGLPVYGIYSTRTAVNGRIAALEQELQTVRSQEGARIQELSADLKFIADKMDITTHDLEQSRALAERLKQDNAQNTQRLRSEIASHSRTMNELRQQTEAVQQDATTKFGAVTGEVQTVRVDLDNTKTDLAANRKEIGDVRDTLSREIAHNSSEVAELRRRGERDYFEFDIEKSRNLERIADVKLQLKKADSKRQKYDILMQVDDSKIEKKERTANEPVTFLVGRDRLRYELVVNYVDKNRIRGYLSTPKDKVLAAEGPAFRATKQ